MCNLKHNIKCVINLMVCYRLKNYLSSSGRGEGGKRLVYQLL